MTIYAQGQQFTIVAPTVPWTTEHPRLARVAEMGGASVLGTLLVALVVWLWAWLRMRGRRQVLSRDSSETTPQ